MDYTWIFLDVIDIWIESKWCLLHWPSGDTFVLMYDYKKWIKSVNRKLLNFVWFQAHFFLQIWMFKMTEIKLFAILIAAKILAFVWIYKKKLEKNELEKKMHSWNYTTLRITKIPLISFLLGCWSQNEHSSSSTSHRGVADNFAQRDLLGQSRTLSV